MKQPRVVIVTGGGSGMGRAIAQLFAANGDNVYVLGRRLEKLEETAKGHKNIYPIVADIVDPQSIENAKEELLKKEGGVDVLVNCAGGNTKTDPNAKLTEALVSWNSVLSTNLTTTFNAIFIFGPFLSKPGGRIINITSTAALGGSSLGGVSGQAYSAAKSGIHGMSRTLANVLSPEGITINSLSPGVIDDTEFFGGDGVPEERKGAYLSKIPIGRLGKPKEVAAGVFYLASEEAGFITGEILNINGGMQFGR